MVNAHPIDTAIAASYDLVGRPWLVGPGVFVQRSWTRGRPWLRLRHGERGWDVTAYASRAAAIAGDFGGGDRGRAFDYGGGNVWG